MNFLEFTVFKVAVFLVCGLLFIFGLSRAIYEVVCHFIGKNYE